MEQEQGWGRMGVLAIGGSWEGKYTMGLENGGYCACLLACMHLYAFLSCCLFLLRRLMNERFNYISILHDYFRLSFSSSSFLLLGDDARIANVVHIP